MDEDVVLELFVWFLGFLIEALIIASAQVLAARWLGRREAVSLLDDVDDEGVGERLDAFAEEMADVPERLLGLERELEAARKDHRVLVAKLDKIIKLVSDDE